MLARGIKAKVHKNSGVCNKTMCKGNFRDSVLFAKKKGTTNIIISSLPYYIHELNCHI